MEIKRQNLEFQVAENLANSTAMALKRQNPEFKAAENLASKTAMEIKRQNIEFKAAENLASSTAMALKRQDLDFRFSEQAIDNLAKVAKRQNTEYRQIEQGANTSLRANARLDDTIRDRDLNIKTTSNVNVKLAKIANQDSNLVSGEMMPVYFENQHEYLCGQHAINNLFQYKLFNTNQLIGYAQTLALEFPGQTFYTKEPTRGNFTTHVLTRAIEKKGLGIQNINTSRLEYFYNSGVPFMLLITHLGHHFSARRFVQNEFIWIFDSINKFPYKDKTNRTLFDGLMKHYNQCTLETAPFVQEIKFTDQFEVRNFGDNSAFKEYRAPKFLRQNEYVMTFLREPVVIIQENNLESEIMEVDLTDDQIIAAEINATIETATHSEEVVNKKIKNAPSDKIDYNKLPNLLVEVERAMANFHKNIERWEIQLCSICKAGKPYEFKPNDVNAFRCRKCIANKVNANYFASELADPGSVPSHLPKLTFIEEQLISLVQVNNVL